MLPELIVAEEDAGQRIDLYLSKVLKDLSRSRIQKMLNAGKVRAAGRVVKASYRLRAGEKIVYELPLETKIVLQPEKMPLEILYEDQALLVVNKPANLLVHPVGDVYSGTLVNGLLAHCTTLSQQASIRPGIVHRLDRLTSGLLVVAKTDAVHQDLVEQFQKRIVLRRYLVLVHGVVNEPGGLIQAPLGRDPHRRLHWTVVSQGGREALTYYRLVEQFTAYSLLVCDLKTGRTHQLRVHLAYLGHPVVGDSKYGFQNKALGLKGHGLHAWTLGFYHPLNGKWLCFRVSPPADFEEALQRLQSKKGIKFFKKGGKEDEH
ncbi:MAG TPA: RluA family pseudouridine synthase [Clostridia bacterium]|nr:RluA family pseudouridine synthase [Clostridia bacterium]